MKKIFQVDSEIVKKTLSDCFNYEIIYNEKAEKKTAIIYFSSNGIYFPNTEEEFKKTVLNKNRYEWKKNLIPNCHKHIFIRDIRKQWYLNGINREINSLESLEDFLKKETAGYDEIITTGSSSGGFASVLFGIKLNTAKIFSFNGQFDIGYLLNEADCETKNPIIFQRANDLEVKKYFNLEKYIKEFNGDIFYFASLHSGTEQRQMAIAEKYKNIIKIYFQEAKHGLPFDPYLLKKIINLKNNKLKKLGEKIWTRNDFSKEIAGSVKTATRIAWKKMEFYIKSKLLKMIKK